MLYTRLCRIRSSHPLIGIRERKVFELIKFKLPYPTLPLQAPDGIYGPCHAALLRMRILDRQRNSRKKVPKLSARYPVWYLSDNDTPKWLFTECRVDISLGIEPPIHGRVRQSESDGVDIGCVGGFEGLAVLSLAYLGRDDYAPVVSLIAKGSSGVSSRKVVSAVQSHSN